MKKKTWIISGIVILAAVVAGLIFLYSNLDYIVKTAIERYGPRFTQTAVRVGSVKLTLRSGECKIKRFLIGNPKGFKTDYAFKTDLIDVGIQPASITKKVLHIRKIIVLSPQINYESQSNANNFETIQRNIEKSLGSEKSSAVKGKKEKSPEKKMIVDTLILRDVRVTYSSALVKANLTLPSIEMYNIGKNKGGVTGGELAMLITQTLSLRIGRAVGAAALKNAASGGSTKDLLKGIFK
ncbi:MAG: hypothetical protein EHM45_15350 [Desulfobacteraceae bacterium]|nr:MAG: hypothetical protein EHM45_15350 [Desulfobacteraceae bacterium]